MKAVGTEGETVAVNHLTSKGYKILHRNYRTPVGEADIIAESGSAIVFIEVKARTSDIFGQPFEAVNYRKQEKLKRIALYYLKHHNVQSPVRFDVISILYNDKGSKVTHIVEAF